MMKQAQCCARLSGRLNTAKDDLRRLARLEAYHAQKGHNVSRFPELLRNAKAEIARVEAAITEHTAEHAASFEVDEHGKRVLPA